MIDPVIKIMVLNGFLTNFWILFIPKNMVMGYFDLIFVIMKIQGIEKLNDSLIWEYSFNFKLILVISLFFKLFTTN